MKREILVGASLFLASCSPGTPEVEPTPTTWQTPASTIPEISQQATSECLQNGAQTIIGNQITSIGTAECRDYVDEMYEDLSEEPMYRPYLTKKVTTHSGYVFGPPGKFQQASGIPSTNVFDAQTVQTMRAELDRLERPAYTCEPDSNPDDWTRQELVNRLAGSGSFLIKIGNSGAARSDLLDPNMSRPELIRELGYLAKWAECSDVQFSLLAVKTDHAENTTSGNISQHTLGLAGDIRPFNGDEPLLGQWLGHVGDPLDPAEWIVNNPRANSMGLKIMEFLKTRASKLRQTIWTEAPEVVQHGKARANFSHGTAVDDTHHEHIHIGVNG